MPRGIQANPTETGPSEDAELPGAIVLDELVVEVVLQGSDEFICGDCFTVRHHGQAATETGA